MKRLITASVLLVGCTEGASLQTAPLDHRAVQPLVIAPAPERVEEPREDIAPEHLDPLLEHNVGAVVEYAGLIEPSAEPRPDWVVTEPGDLMTSIRGTQPSLVFGPESRLYERCVRERSCLRIVTYPEGELVEAELRFPEPGYGDISRRIVLIPAREFEDRWYAVEVTVDAAVNETVRGERAQLARFRPDSHPILTHLLMGSHEGQSIVEVRFSERVAGDVPASAWTLSDERGQLQCSVLGPERGREEHHAVFNCERLPEGRARIDFGGTMQTVLGTELVDANERAMATVEFDAEPPVREGRDGDSARETVRRVPVFTM
jgi:hypothetical protein